MKMDISTLPDDSRLLKEMLVELLGMLDDLQVRFDKETGILLEQIQHLRAQLFGRKSEKPRPHDGAVPLPLFDMPEPDVEEEAEPLKVKGHERRKGGRKPLPENLPRVEIVHDIPAEEKICACGQVMSRIGEEVSEQLDIIPAKIQVLRNIRPKYACKACEGVEDDGPTVKIAPVPPQLIPKSIASPGLIAFILSAKFIDHTPFYRQEKQFFRLGVVISRTSMCGWSMQTAAACMSLLNLLRDELLAGSYINIDETTLQVLKEPGRDPTSKSYMWIFRRGDPDRKVLIYQYHPTRCGDVARSFLGDFQGVVQTDGYSGYDFLDHVEGIRHIGCWAHARRKFMDVISAQGKKRQPGAADKALAYIGRLYKLEKEAKAKTLSVEEIYRMRQAEARPILTEMHQWLANKSLRTPPKGLLGKAVSYALNQWRRLIGYLEDGRLAMDNNAAENAIRPFVIGRKNWLFSGTPEGAEASALLYSLIETAKANGWEPYAYLRQVFEKLPLASTVEDLDALLPWNMKPEPLPGSNS